MRFRDFLIDDIKKFCKGQTNTFPWLLSLEWDDNNDNKLPFNPYWYVPEYAQVEESFSYLYCINKSTQIQQFIQQLPNDFNSRITFIGLVISRLHIVRASREWGQNEIRAVEFLKTFSNIGELSDIYENTINRIIQNRHPLLQFDNRIDNRTLLMKSVIAHTIILHASMDANVSPLTTFLHKL